MMSSRMSNSDHGTIVTSLMEVTQDYVRNEIPLSLAIHIPGLGEVICGKVLRAIRGKRIACLGKAGGTSLIVKLYFAKYKSRRNWRHSDSGCRSFIERGIPAPGILFSGYLSEYGIYALVLEYIDGGVRIDAALDSMPEKQMREKLLDSLIKTLARHHASGVLQNDLHLGNFLTKDEIIYSLDGDQVVRRGASLWKKRSLANLARLLASLPFIVAGDLEARIDAYARERKWSISDADRAALQDMVFGIRRKNLSGYLSKVMKSKDPFLASSEQGLFSVFDKRHLDVSLPKVLEASKRSIPAKSSLGKAGFRVFTIGDADMLLLSAYCVGPLVLKGLWSAVGVWENALMLNRIGIATPQPIALTLTKRFPLFWLGSVFFEPVGGKDLREFFNTPSVTEEEKYHIAAALADAFACMHAMGITAGRIDPERVIVSGRNIIFLNPATFRRSVLSIRSKQARMAGIFLAGCKDIPDLRGLLTEYFKKKNLI